jgi:hypothetical protein
MARLLIAVPLLVLAVPVAVFAHDPAAPPEEWQPEVKVRELPPHWYETEMADFAIVDTDIEPEEALLYLDGRFIGSADDFDGHPDFLYLEPGRYRLECRHRKLPTRVLELEVEAGLRYKLDFEMKEHRCRRPSPEGRYDPDDIQRHYAPCDRVECPPKTDRRETDRQGDFR